MNDFDPPYQSFTVTCAVPFKRPSETITATLIDSTTVNYESLNNTVFMGTVLTYQCDDGLIYTVWASEYHMHG